MRVGAILKKWRLVMDLNTQEVGARIGISSAAVYRLEDGRIPDGQTLIKLQNWLFSEEPNANSGDQRTDEAVPSEVTEGD